MNVATLRIPSSAFRIVVPTRPTNRREFLQGKAAVQAAQELVDRLVEEPPLDDGFDAAAGDSYLVRIGRRAMACEFEVLLNAGQYPHGSAAALEALDLIDRLESQMTVYRGDSEISELNARAFDEPVEVELRLFDVLTRGIELYRQTGGAYDLTSGPLSRVWGFYCRAGRVPSDDELAEAKIRVGTDKLDVDRNRRTIRFLTPGMEINLGSIGKGYALDRCAELMAANGIQHYLLHGGQSSVLARGSRGHFALGEAAVNQGWWIGVRHPERPQQRLVEVRVGNKALATSGSAVQFFLYEGKRYGHILDPRSGRPAEGTLSATVVAPAAAEADAVSTACYVMGRDAATDFCRERPEFGLIIVSPGSKSGSIQVDTLNIADEDLRWH
jgi:thiamine biosynthesis lipoprotein